MLIQAGEKRIQVVDQQDWASAECAAIVSKSLPCWCAILFLPLYSATRRMRLPEMVEGIKLSRVGMFIFTGFQQGLQAVAPKYIEADDVVLFFPKREGDKARFEHGVVA